LLERLDALQSSQNCACFVHANERTRTGRTCLCRLCL
jgi:hypothetical protein